MKEYKNFLSIMLFISGIGVIIGTFYDFKIAQVIFNESNRMCIFFELICYYPLYMALPVLVGILTVRNQNWKIISFVLGVLSVFITITEGVIFLKERNIVIIKEYFFPIIIMVFLVSCVVQILLCNVLKKTNKDIIDKIYLICIFAVLLILWKVVTINGVKLIMGRARYCNIVHGNGYYTPWYIINRPRMGKSFPSGHVSGACGILLILLIPLLFEKLKKYKYLFETIAGIYIFISAFSRMILGKHMISDVSAAVFLMCVGFMTLLMNFEKIKKLVDEN